MPSVSTVFKRHYNGPLYSLRTAPCYVTSSISHFSPTSELFQDNEEARHGQNLLNRHSRSPSALCSHATYQYPAPVSYVVSFPRSTLKTSTAFTNLGRPLENCTHYFRSCAGPPGSAGWDGEEPGGSGPARFTSEPKALLEVARNGSGVCFASLYNY